MQEDKYKLFEAFISKKLKIPSKNFIKLYTVKGKLHIIKTGNIEQYINSYKGLILENYQVTNKSGSTTTEINILYNRTDMVDSLETVMKIIYVKINNMNDKKEKDRLLLLWIGQFKTMLNRYMTDIPIEYHVVDYIVNAINMLSNDLYLLRKDIKQIYPLLFSIAFDTPSQIEDEIFEKLYIITQLDSRFKQKILEGLNETISTYKSFIHRMSLYRNEDSYSMFCLLCALLENVNVKTKVFKNLESITLSTAIAIMDWEMIKETLEVEIKNLLNSTDFSPEAINKQLLQNNETENLELTNKLEELDI